MNEAEKAPPEMRRPDTSPSEGRLRLGTALVDMSRKIGVTNADVDALGEVLGEAHDGTPAEPMRDPWTAAR